MPPITELITILSRLLSIKYKTIKHITIFLERIVSWGLVAMANENK